MSAWGEDLAAWWLSEVAADPVYEEQVLPLALEMLGPSRGRLYLDLGCGDGRLLAALSARGSTAIGVDASELLAVAASRHGPVAVSRLPDLGFVATSSVDGVTAVLVSEHLDAVETLFVEAARVTRPRGVMAMVVNHPLLTAPGSGPFLDPDDGEVLWRWGRYLSAGFTDEPAGPETVRFHHRPLGSLLTTAASAGWGLEAVAERAVSRAKDPVMAVQDEVPRLLGLRWRKGPSPSPRRGEYPAVEPPGEGGR